MADLGLRHNTGLGLRPPEDLLAGTPFGQPSEDEAALRVRGKSFLPAPRKSRVPQFKDNPIGAIGFLLQQAGASALLTRTPSKGSLSAIFGVRNGSEGC